MTSAFLGTIKHKVMERTEDQEWITAQATFERLWRTKQQHFQSMVREISHLESHIEASQAKVRELESVAANLEVLKQQLSRQQLELEAKTSQVNQLETQLRNLPKAPEAAATEIKVLRDRVEMKDRQIAELTRQRNLTQRKDENSKSMQEKEVERLKTLLAFRDADLKQIEWQKAQEKATRERPAEHRSPSRQIRLPVPSPRKPQPETPEATPPKQLHKEKTKAKPVETPARLNKLRKNVLRDSQSLEEEADSRISQLLRPASSPKKASASSDRRKSVFYVPVQQSMGGVKGFNITVEAAANSQYH